MNVDRRPTRRGSSRSPFARFQAESLETRELLTVSIAQSSYVLANNATSAVVTLTRAPNPVVNPETVQVATTTAGTARPGIDFTAVSQDVTFNTGEYTKQVTIPLLNVGHTDDRTIGVTVTGNDAVGNRAITGSTTVALVGRSDIAPPTITKAVQLRSKGRLTGFAITFSEDMATRPAANVNNFVVTAALTKSGGFSLRNRTSTFNVPLKSATYDATTHTVYLTTKRAYNPATTYAIANANANGSPLTDVAGNYLDSQGKGTADAVLAAEAASFQRDTRGITLLRPGQKAKASK